MKKLIFIFFCLLQMILFSRFADAATQKAYVTLGDHVARYVEYTPPVGHKPTLILVNGLVYDLSRWKPYSQQLLKNGYGVLNYYFRGQHLTLKKEAQNQKTPAFFETGLDVADLAMELNALLVEMRLKGPFVVVGLSYGSSIAAEFANENPQKVSELIFLAPLVQSLSNYDPAGAWLNWNLEAIKLWWGPIFGPPFYEMAYSQIYRTYLTQRIVPDRVPRELQEMPEIYKEAIFQLVRAVRSFDLKDYHFEKLPPASVHFFLAKEESPLVFNDQIKAFDLVQNKAKGNLIYLPKAQHAIPDSQGAAAAQLTEQLLKKDSRLKPGSKYYLTPQGQLAPWKN